MLAPFPFSRSRYLAAAAVLAALAGSVAARGGEPTPVPAPAPAPAPATGRSYLTLNYTVGDAALRKPVPIASDEVTDGVLDLRGPVNKAMRELFNNAVARADVTTVRISSQGGDAVEAIQIGTTMQARGIDVVVRGMCLGSCAQYIFIAGRRRQIEPGGLVAFMASIKSEATLIGIATDTLEVRNPLDSTFTRFEAAELELYHQSGVSEALLMDSEIARQPRCVTMRRRGSVMNWNTTSTYRLWVPTREYLQMAGVEFEGEWPATRAYMLDLADHFLRSNTVRIIRFGDEDHLHHWWQKKYSLEKLRECVLDELPQDSAQ